MNNNINIDAVIKACDTLSHRIITVGGERRGSSFLFNQCMRAFDRKALPAEAITFAVFLNVPVMKDATATIHRDGRLEIHTDIEGLQ